MRVRIAPLRDGLAAGMRGSMYQGDSFFTLTGWGQVGLAFLSVVLAVGMLSLCLWLAKGRARVVIALVLFWLFVWLSPQVYYAYYRIIIEGLPQQWVIGWPRCGEAFGYLTFTGPGTLSAHGQGLLGWLMILLALFRSKIIGRNK